MADIYTSGQYLEKTVTWHAEDSAWKAGQIAKMIRNIDAPSLTVAEIGCGAGRILQELSQARVLPSASFYGYDISPQAIELCKTGVSSDVQFVCGDLLAADESVVFDILLAIDVFEHVPDYIGFLQKCRKRASRKIYHIPLDIHVSGVLRKRLISVRKSVGHLHQFTAETAIATLIDTGHEIEHYFYTCGALGLFREHPSLRRAIANCPRWLVSRLSVPLAARLLGGYSLMVLAK